jgi:hypothetical protein
VLPEGDSVTELPVPTGVPAQLPLYHFQLAPAPRLPPLTLNVVDVPLHMVVVPVIEFAGLEVSLTVTVTLLQGEFLHVPSARTK